MNISYIIQALLRKKWLIILCTLIAGGATFFFTRNTPKKYKSTAQISTGFTVSEEIKLSDEKFNLPQIDVKFNNAIENITSPKVLSLLSYRLMLHDLKSTEPFAKLNKDEKERESKLNINKDKVILTLNNKIDSLQILSPAVELEKNILAYLDIYKYSTGSLLEGLTVARYQRTDYININYVSKNPQLSAYVVNTLCTEFRRFYGTEQKERTDISAVALDSLLKVKKADLDKKVEAKNSFMSSSGVLDIGLEGSNKLGQVGTFESQLIEEQANQQNISHQIKELQRLIQEANSKGVTSIKTPTVSNNALNNSEYIELRKQYNELNLEYQRKGSNDYEIKKRLDELSDKMRKLNFSSTRPLTNNNSAEVSISELEQRKIILEGQLKAINTKISMLQSKISQLNGGLSGMASKGANIQQMDKEIEMATAEYREANDRYNMALKMNEPLPGIFKQAIIGEPALRPEASGRFMMIALSLVAAFVISCIVIIAIEFLDQSVKTPSHFQRISGLPLLGTINHVKFQGKSILDNNSLFDGKENRDNIFRELLRKLRFELENSKKKVYLFTSTEPNQGKTTLIQSLAYSLSLSKKSVLIVDTNFCNNDLTNANDAIPSLEKFNLTGKEFELSDADSFISKTSIEGVDIIGCQGGDYTPSEILPKNHLLNYLTELKVKYDYIFLEGAPLNHYTDSKELVQYVDGVIAIFSADAVISAADRKSIQFLNDNKGIFIGAILNKVQGADLRF